jgi:hypothetical protein
MDASFDFCCNAPGGLRLELPPLHVLIHTSGQIMFDVTTTCCNGSEGSMMTLISNSSDHGLQCSALSPYSGFRCTLMPEHT